jgi:hypothetical protein
VCVQVVFTNTIGLLRTEWTAEWYIGTRRRLRVFSGTCQSNLAKVQTPGVGHVDLIHLVALDKPEYTT